MTRISHSSKMVSSNREKANRALSYENIRVTALDKNSVVFIGEGPWSATDMEGNIIKGHLVSMFVFVNRNNKWQMIHGHTSHTFDK